MKGLHQLRNYKRSWIGIGKNLINPTGRLEGIMRDTSDTYMRKRAGMFIIME